MNKVDLSEELEQLFLDDLPEDFNPMDMYGGNFDDAFYGGQEHGESDLAKRIVDRVKELEEYKWKYEELS